MLQTPTVQDPLKMLPIPDETNREWVIPDPIRPFDRPVSLAMSEFDDLDEDEFDDFDDGKVTMKVICQFRIPDCVFLDRDGFSLSKSFGKLVCNIDDLIRDVAGHSSRPFDPLRE